MNIITNSALIMRAVFGVVGLVIIGLGVYWLFNKQARLRDLAEVRKRLDRLNPTDSEYGAVRALYTSMVLDAERWGLFGVDGGHMVTVVALTTAAIMAAMAAAWGGQP
jgi:hypothetical protein